MAGKTNKDDIFVDIIKPRNTQFGIFRFMTKSWVPKKTLVLDKCYTPEELKDLVVKSVFMDTFLNAESVRQGVPVEKLKYEMLEYLNEIAFEKKIHIVRWIGLAFLKICFMMKIGVFVNEPAVLKLKESMGNKPVLFLPTHRSYADFCLMTYLCFHYDIDLPAVAAGMDFHAMAVIGQRMREMCAFYMRRTLIDAPLYAATLRQYVRTVVAHHSAPIEFFVEGTRSRSNKSLAPRYGMLSMALLPYFAREVADVTVVPVNISYERIMEVTLFAYEHLGMPKPRESTEGLLKSMQTLNDHFGNVYVNVGEPISVHEFVSKNVNGGRGVRVEDLKPMDLQVLTAEQLAVTAQLANEVVVCHQKCTTVTMSTLLSMVLMESVMKNRSLHLDDVLKKVQWFADVLVGRGGRVVETDVAAAVDRMLVVHRRMLALDGARHLRLVASARIEVTSDVKNKMKGHTLRAETMMNAVPVIELQTYVNPALHLLAPPALLLLLVRAGNTTVAECHKKYHHLRLLLRHEIFYSTALEKEKFLETLQYCTDKDLVVLDGQSLSAGTNRKLQYLLEWAILPTFTSMTYCMDTLTQMKRGEHRAVLRAVQQWGERGGGHPYGLSLEAAAGCLKGLVDVNALLRSRRGKSVHYEVVPDEMRKCSELVQSMMPQLRVDYSAHNRAFGRSVASRL